ILFVSANYVFGLWHTRAALGEIWVYSLLPWVVTSILPPHSMRWLAALLFIQACAHPLVFPASLLAEFMVAIALSAVPFFVIVRQCIVALIIALVLALPFWLPQLLGIDFVRGNAALPVEISDT